MMLRNVIKFIPQAEILDCHAAMSTKLVHRVVKFSKWSNFAAATLLNSSLNLEVTIVNILRRLRNNNLES